MLCTIPAYESKEPLLTVKDVSFNRGATSILRNLNLRVLDLVRPGVKQGQVCALLGPSGVGKSTCFRLLAGLEKPHGGTITLAHDQPVRRGLVGVVSQNYQLFDHRTVLSNLTVAAKMGGHPSGEVVPLAKQYLERFNLHEHASKYPAQLSGGQRQRAAIAQQLLCSEGLLLMDEPFSGLDLLALRSVTSLIRNVAQTGEEKTFIIVTHDIRAALEVADTVWLLGRERTVEGAIVPGAFIKETYNLVDCGVAWQDESQVDTPHYRDLVRQIEEKFLEL